MAAAATEGRAAAAATDSRTYLLDGALLTASCQESAILLRGRR
jgi:hypothetical protein